MSAELEKCPFCGGAVQPRHCLDREDGGSDAIIHAEPSTCGMSSFSIDTADHGVSVAAAWNRRPPASSERVALSDDELCDIAEDFKSQYVHGGTTFDEFDSVGFGRAIQATHGIVALAPRPDAPTSQINPGSAPREDGR